METTSQRLSLNIGCGKDIYGDIRLDLSSTGDLVASAEYLPFKDSCFSNTRMWHVLEHCKKPEQAYREALRVTNGTCHFRFPWKYDRIPFVLNMLSSFNIRLVYYAIHDCVRHILTQLRFTDSPWCHRWTIQPNTSHGLWSVNRIPIISIFVSGRKAKYLSRLSLNVYGEWEGWV